MTARNRADTTATASSRPPAENKLARLVTELLAPTPTVVLLFLVVAWRGAVTVADAVRWGALTVAFSVLPLLYVLRGVHHQRLTDHHLTRREQRPRPLLIGLALLLLLLKLLVAGGAPRELLALVGSMIVGLAVGLLVTLRWQISGHAMVAASTVVVLTYLFGPSLLILSPLVALVAWARVRLGDHTPAQVIAGGALGAVSTTTFFSLLMTYLP